MSKEDESSCDDDDDLLLRDGVLHVWHLHGRMDVSKGTVSHVDASCGTRCGDVVVDDTHRTDVSENCKTRIQGRIHRVVGMLVVLLVHLLAFLHADFQKRAVPDLRARVFQCAVWSVGSSE